jgi:hypothetical protein
MYCPAPPCVAFHAGIQQEASRRAHYESTAAVVFGLVAVALLRGRQPD